MTTRITAVIDPTGAPADAVAWAVGLAAPLGAPVRVLAALHHPYAELPADDADRLRDDAAETLTAQLRGAHLHVDDVVAEFGPVVDTLTTASRESMLLVVDTADHDGWGGHRHVVRQLAHRAECPIAVIPPGPWNAREPVAVVGVDGSEASYATLHWALQFAQRAALDVVAGFVVDDIYTTFNSGGWYGTEERRAERESAIADVELVERFGADPAASLTAIVDERKAALLVVGAKDHRSLGGTLLGAIPDELLREPRCPVLLVPHSMTASGHTVEAW